MENKIETCLVCGKEISKNNGDVCSTCLTFLKWKYKKDFKKVILLYKEIFKSTKSNRRNKMDSYKCSCGAYTTNEDGICDMCEIREIENEASLREEREE